MWVSHVFPLRVARSVELATPFFLLPPSPCLVRVRAKVRGSNLLEAVNSIWNWRHIVAIVRISPTTSFLPDLAHERATSPLFKASAFAFRSFPLLIRLPSAFAPLSNKRHHHHRPIKLQRGCQSKKGLSRVFLKGRTNQSLTLNS